MDQWLTVCRNSVEGLKALYKESTTVAERDRYTGTGAGGDHTLVIDEQSEDIVFAELERVSADGENFTVISEERGEIDFGSDQTFVVIDPIDGSLNAKRTIPFFTLSFAVASGNTMTDVDFGYIYDFGASEEFYAIRGTGAYRNSERLTAPVDRGLEVVGVESSSPEWLMPLLPKMDGQVFRLRCLGTIALNLAYVASGRLDGLVTARPCRSVDAAAGQLITREAGAQADFDCGLDKAELNLDARYRCFSASTPSGLDALMNMVGH